MAYNGKRASPIRIERKKTTRSKNQESFFSIKWDLTAFKLLMNQFHSWKKFVTVDIVTFIAMVH